jgi:ABC-type transporter Mla maintaining outer membrane lipid asymmetry ATPase subunit MlaF
VENLAARFDGRTVFEGVGFEVRRGEVFVILGGSGCGKSTLLKHMIGCTRRPRPHRDPGRGLGGAGGPAGGRCCAGSA